ncbi:MAG: hypothetical protein JWQ73_4241 [Variovorax sp.]|nr:hypothetical protein [Variovorax sp.]
MIFLLAEVCKNFGAKPLCTAAFSQDVRVVKVDLSGMSPAQLNGLLTYASRFWPGSEFKEADPRKVDYFLVQNQSMTGVTEIFIFIPLARIPLPLQARVS